MEGKLALREVPNSIAWLLLLNSKSECLKAHLKSFLLCTLIENFLITRNLAQISIKKPDSNILNLYKGEVLLVFESLVDTCNYSIQSKQALFADLEAEADIERALIWNNFNLNSPDKDLFKEIFNHELMKEIFLTGHTDLGLFLRYFQGYFRIKLKANLQKFINNDKYHFLLHPMVRSLDCDDAHGPVIVQHETMGISTYGSLVVSDTLKGPQSAEKLEEELLTLEHITVYAYFFGTEASPLIQLLCHKTCLEALDLKSLNEGKPWIDKALALVANSQM
jgi:hypothetical protein